jgi:hypothetical protein
MVVLVTLSLPNLSHAQQGEATVLDDSLLDATIVLSTCLGGAILGLSTLSFVEVPKDHFNNIIVGGAIGIIIGVGVVAFNQAGKSKDLYLENAKIDAKFFETGSRLAWHQKSFKENTIKSSEIPQMQFSFNF